MRPSGLAARQDDPSMRRTIADSWRRAELAGLTPATAFDGLRYGAVDTASALVVAAAPVLDNLNERLTGTGFTTLLVDRDGRVARRWSSDDRAIAAFDGLGVDAGASLLEERIGTNAPGTVLETRGSVMVNADEHFAEPLRAVSCYGHPIVHPVTRRIEGVLDVSALMTTVNPLVPPLVAGVVAEIEQRLLDGSRVSERRLLGAFQAAAHRRRPVVALHGDTLICNQAATDLLSATDIALLRILAADLPSTGGPRLPLTLESGERVEVRGLPVESVRDGVVLQIERVRGGCRPDGSSGSVASGARLDVSPSVAPVLVSGPPGSGRTTQARSAARSTPITVLTATSALLDGPAEWARRLDALVRARQGVVCVEGVDLLPADLLALVAAHATAGHPPQLVLTSGPAETLQGPVAALAATCIDRRELAPLAARTAELPELAAAMIDDLGAGAGGDPGESVHLGPGVLRVLSAHDWPGNLRELRAVLEHAVRRRRRGAITVDDLPESHRVPGASRALSPMERAERDAVVVALREAGGNKVQAARALGISRTTLYAKMRTLRVTVD
ncbi:MAG: helix-turn-helix domain-containing protein [Nocardioides alkalitolerans]